MAKLPTIERFRITCEVDAPSMGVIVAQLTRMGLANIHYELVTDVLSYKGRTNHEVNAEDFLQAWLQHNPTFKVKEAVAHARENGRTDAAIYRAVRVLCDKKLLRKLGPGQYSRADVKALAPPKRDHFEVDHRQAILNFAQAHKGHFLLSQIRDLFAKQGRKKKSIAGAIGALKKTKKIRNVGAGEYVLLTAGRPKKKKPPKKAGKTKPHQQASAGNGRAVEEVSHG